MWETLETVSQQFRRLPLPVRMLSSRLIMGAFRFGTTRLHYGFRSLALTIAAKEAGSRLIVGPGVYVIEPHRLSLGSGVSINHFCYLDASGELTIGSNTRIGSHSSLITGNHNLQTDTIRRSPITLDEGAWIGSGCRILAGVRVGAGATVGAGAVVNRDVPQGKTVVGVPAREK